MLPGPTYHAVPIRWSFRGPTQRRPYAQSYGEWFFRYGVHRSPETRSNQRHRFQPYFIASSLLSEFQPVTASSSTELSPYTGYFPPAHHWKMTPTLPIRPLSPQPEHRSDNPPSHNPTLHHTFRTLNNASAAFFGQTRYMFTSPVG